MYGKRIELLKLAVPGLSKAGLIVSQANPTFNVNSQWARDLETAARSLKLSPTLLALADEITE